MSFGWRLKDWDVRVGWEVLPVGRTSLGSSSMWVELLSLHLPSWSPLEDVVEPWLGVASALVLTDTVTAGVVNILLLDVGAGMGWKGPGSNVGGFLTLGIVPLWVFRILLLDGHCWRPQRARLLGFFITSQGSFWFLAHVTLRILTPPPQETEHWKRE